MLQDRANPTLQLQVDQQKARRLATLTPFEVFGRHTIWTATYIRSHLVGIKVTSKGTTEHPKNLAIIFLERSQDPEKLDEMKISLAHSIGADGDLTEFYELAQ